MVLTTRSASATTRVSRRPSERGRRAGPRTEPSGGSANVPTAPILRGRHRSTNLGRMKFSSAIAIASLALPSVVGTGAALVACGSSGSNADKGDGGANAGQAFNPGGSSGGGEGGSSQGLT